MIIFFARGQFAEYWKTGILLEIFHYSAKAYNQVINAFKRALANLIIKIFYYS